MSSSPNQERRPEGTNLYVSNLSYSTSEQDLEDKFANFGKITSVKIIKDPNTRKSRGFGFVTFEEADDAEKAIEKMNNSEIDGRAVRVEKARDSRGQRKSGGGNYSRQRRSPQRSRRDDYRDRSPRRRSPRHRSRSP